MDEQRRARVGWAKQVTDIDIDPFPLGFHPVSDLDVDPGASTEPAQTLVTVTYVKNGESRRERRRRERRQRRQRRRNY